MFFYSLYWFLVALLLALTEIEVEGRYGWSEKTQTWSKKFSLKKISFGKILSTRTLTGYHIFLNLFLFIFAHSPFVFFREFSISAELQLLSTYLIWNIFWDFLWFIMNPYYGLSKFKPKSVWWFGEEPWVLGKLPLKYFLQLALALLFVYIAQSMNGTTGLVLEQIELILWCIIFSVLTHFLLRPVYHRYYTSVEKLRKKDVI